MQKKILEALIKRDGGGKCPLCGVQLTEDNIVVDHITPRAFGGTDDLSNLRLVCGKCNRKNSFWELSTREFEKYMFEVISKNDNFRNTRTNVILGKEITYIPDIVTERKTGGSWDKLVIEIKYISALTMERVLSIINQFKRYSNSFTDDRILVLLFPGKLSDDANKLLKENKIEVWDSEFLVSTFSKEIKETDHPIFQALLTEGKKETRSNEQKLIDRLKGCKPGKEDWSKYQKLIGEILETLFYPQLLRPLPENADAFRVNRRDYILPNYCDSGFWSFLRSRYYADYIVVDAKNYSQTVTKKEVLQIANYLKLHGTGLFGVIISRKGASESALYTLREVWAIEKKLIIVLQDNDIEQMLLEKSFKREPEIIIRQKIEDFRLLL